MTKDFLATIKRRGVIFDGGMGSMLIAAGLTQREIPEAWLLSKGEKIAEVHAAYLQAGAEVVTTLSNGEVLTSDIVLSAPGRKPFTSGPTASTMPAPSIPGVHGRVMGM